MDKFLRLPVKLSDVAGVVGFVAAVAVVMVVLKKTGLQAKIGA